MPKGQLEVYFSDLKMTAQHEVLDLYGLASEADGNFDTQPLFILEHDKDEEPDNKSQPG